MAESVVSSAQNLIVMSDKVTAEVPLLMTSKVWLFWLEPQVPNSSNCRARELVPHPVPAVGVEVAVEVTIGVGVKVGLNVGEAVRVAVGVMVTVAVAGRAGVEVG